MIADLSLGYTTGHMTPFRQRDGLVGGAGYAGRSNQTSGQDRAVPFSPLFEFKNTGSVTGAVDFALNFDARARATAFSHQHARWNIPRSPAPPARRNPRLKTVNIHAASGMTAGPGGLKD